MKKTIAIKGLDCSACAAELEELLQKIEGIEEASVSFVTQKINLVYADEDALNRALDAASHFEEVEVVREGKRTISVKNLDCSACAAELEEILKKLEGVSDASVSFVNQKISLLCTEEGYQRAVSEASRFEEVEVVSSHKRCILLKNLDCSACAAELEGILKKVEGIEEVDVSFVNQKITLSCTDEGYERAVYEASHFEEVEVVTEQEKTERKKEKVSPWKEHRTDLVKVIVSAVLFLGGFVLELFVMENVPWTKWIALALYAVSFLMVGVPVLIATAKNLAKGKIFDENLLMTVGAIGAIALASIPGSDAEYFEGVAVMLLYQIGELLQAIAVGSSRRSISDLMELKSDFATLLDGDEQKRVTPEDLRVGDKILVKVGEKFPVDVLLLKGQTSVDTKSLTGEAMPRDVEEGAEVLAGSINVGGVVEAQALREYRESAVAKILDMVENSASQKAKPEKFITKFARVYTPVIFFVALFIGGIVPTILGLTSAFSGALYMDWVMRALKVLVISCPCALIISVPLTYFGGIGACASNGILVKGATYLDTLTSVKVALFDKTGTLTEGKFYIAKVNSDRKETLLSYAAAAEAGSNHPVALPFRSVETAYKAEEIKELAGKGIVCSIEGKTFCIGNDKLMEEYAIDYVKCDSLSTVLYAALDGEFLGSIEIEDKIKSGAKETLAELKSLGVGKRVMLTGDSRARAESIAASLGLDEVHAELLPDEKLRLAKAYKKEGAVLYTGDGINDAPVMAESDIAVSMGKIGSDAAIEASDLVLISDSLSSIPKAIKLAKRTKVIVIYNIAFSIAVKLALMFLGIFLPALPLWAAVFADVGVMLIAVLNSLLTRLKVK